MKSQEVSFRKSQKLLASRAGSGARSVSSFCDFRKMTFRDLTAFFSFLTRENLVFFRYSYQRVVQLIILCSIIINFDAWILVSVTLKK